MDKLSQNSRLVIASVLSALIIYVWQVMFVEPMVEHTETTGTPSGTQVPVEKERKAPKLVSREESLGRSYKQDVRVKIDNGTVHGSINLVGARIDDLTLAKYHTELDKTSPEVVMFSPSDTKQVYFTEFGWVKANHSNITLPNNKTVWVADKSILKANDNLNLSWTNGQGVTFNIDISLDDNYMFTVKQSIRNNSREDFEIAHYSVISRTHLVDEAKNMIIHEGAIGVFGKKLEEIEYEDLAEEGKIDFKNQSGWLGFSDKYWLSAIIPDQNSTFTGKFVRTVSNGAERFQADTLSNKTLITKGNVHEHSFNIFAGAKELDLLDAYEQKYGITLFDRAVDFGVLYFITKPIFNALSAFHNFLGNFGIAILLLTVVIKLLLFPLAHKGFKGMNKLKELQPHMAKLKERYKDDNPGMQKALLELYKKEKVNPMAGCLPILLQIPVFFALYKVLYVSIEMRHAPFFGWIKDLSAPDPTSIFNLFGLLPWDTPLFLTIGVFPILMALTMFFQQKLNPEPTDPVQAKVMKLLPLIFLFMFASFPAGLVIYWAWSNILSILQQVLIKRMEGSKVKA